VEPPKNESDLPILPDSELNPLLNPLLAANMGRWAEVYFTSSPEKRAQAVSDLVRELANQPTARPSNYEASYEASDPASEVPETRVEHYRSQESSSSSFEEGRNFAEKHSSAVGEEAALVCESCGYVNSFVQRFCGMCGRPLNRHFEERFAGEEQRPVLEANAGSWDDTESLFEPSESRVGEYASGAQGGDVSPFLADQNQPIPERLSSRSEDVGSLGHRVEEYLLHRDPLPYDHDLQDKPLPQNRLQDNPVQLNSLSNYQSEPERSSSHYRIYFGVILALLLGLLVYKTWRGNAAFHGGSGASSALPQAVPGQPATESESTTPPASSASSASPAPSASSVPQQPNPDRRATGSASPPLARARKQSSASEKKHQKAHRASPAVEAASSPTSTPQANGSEELRKAQKYLSGVGSQRDTQQAVSWLWKAVAKQNLAATLLLSDLYVRGDGVAKSCDQARLLLDAAARKGNSTAADRLRNLKSFGCH